MTYWHTDNFNLFPIGDGYEVEVNEFDFKTDNGICYNQDGVVIRHWRRIHGRDGASAYRLDWNGPSCEPGMAGRIPIPPNTPRAWTFS